MDGEGRRGGEWARLTAANRDDEEEGAGVAARDAEADQVEQRRDLGVDRHATVLGHGLEGVWMWGCVWACLCV